MRNTSLLAVFLVIMGLGILLGGFVYMSFAARSTPQTAWQQSQLPQPQQGYQQGPIGGYRGMMGSGIGQATASAGQPIAIQQAIQEMRTIPAYPNVIASNNTIVFNSKDFRVVVLALMEEDAANLTGHNDLAVLSVAAQISFDSRRLCTKASVVLGGVAPTPHHAVETERCVLGRALAEEVIREGAQKAAERLSPPSDIRASSEYRLQMSRVLTERALKICVKRVSGGV
jgi:hypothetical protein